MLPSSQRVPGERQEDQQRQRKLQKKDLPLLYLQHAASTNTLGQFSGLV
jgi:hypothetical protein